MKRMTFLCPILAFNLFTFLVPYLSFSEEKPTNWEVYFSRNEGCTDAIARELDKAQSTVLFQVAHPTRSKNS